MRTARIPGGVHGFPTLPPADTQIGNTVARTYTEGTSLYADMLEANSKGRRITFISRRFILAL